MTTDNIKTSGPKVAIILLNYNGWADTVECMESIFASDYRNFRIILVDNASADGSIGHFKEWAAVAKPPEDNLLRCLYLEYRAADKSYRAGGVNGSGNAGPGPGPEPDPDTESSGPHLAVISSDSNTGFAEGNNIGIRYALSRGGFDYIWILNNDTTVKGDALRLMLKAMEENATAGIVGSSLFRYHEDEKIQAFCGTEAIGWKNGGKGRHITSIEGYSGKSCGTFEIKGYIVGASMLFRRKAIEDAGLFDEKYFMWGEDSDICMSAARKGWKLFCCCKAVVWHKEGGSTGKDEIKSFLWRKSRRPGLKRFLITGYLDARNHLYFVRKHYGNKYIPLYAAFNLPALAKQVIRILMYDDDKAVRILMILKGLFDGLAGNMGKPEGI